MSSEAHSELINLASAGTTGTGQFLYQLLDPAAATGIAIQEARFTQRAEEDNQTAIGDTAMRFRNGLSSWEIEVVGRFPKATRRLGNTGLITVGSGTATIARAYEFDLLIEWEESESTPLDKTGYGSDAANWMFYRPSIYPKFSGSWKGRRDDSTVETGLWKYGDTVPGLTFRLSDEATDNTLALAAVTVGKTWSGNKSARGIQEYGFDWVGDGALTVAGSNNLFAAGALAAQVMSDSSGIPNQAMVWESKSGGPSHTGKGFVKSVRVSLASAGIITVNVSVRGTGQVDLA